MGKSAARSATSASAAVSVEAKPGSVLPVDESLNISNYAAALKFLNDRIDVERMRVSRVDREAFKLDRVRALLGVLGNPQDAIRKVHVAGSKGKGSVCEMAAACLEGCDYTVGLFTSPHLVDVRERVRINRRPIPHADFTRLMQHIADASRRMDPQLGELSFFEVMTALGFLYFADQAVDVAVIETGLGGRLDATNVQTPDVVAITRISLEHTALLGDTLEEIAREKAGVFKPGVPIVTYEQPAGVLEVLKEQADAVGAPLYVLRDDIDFSYRFESSHLQGPHMRVCLTTERSCFEHLSVPLKGEHQALNCGLALAIVDRLAERGLSANEAAVTRGLAMTDTAGRLDLAWERPRIVLDGAHTPESVRALIRAIGAHIPYDSMVIIFGCAADKDIDGMLEQVALGADKIIFTRASANPRAAKPDDLARRCTETHGKMCQSAKDVEEAIRLAARAVGRDDLICITGSYYLVGEAKKYLQQAAKKAAGG